jgi:aconitate hydratase
LQNLSNFGILPLIFANPDDWEKIDQGDRLSVPDVRSAIRQGNSVKVINLTKNETYDTEHRMTQYQVDMVLSGSLINLVKQKAS